MMKKLKEIKEAIKNTSPEKLARIEYQSHFLQILGVTLVCAILIYRGLWWIIFAFIFSLGVSYSQGIAAWNKHQLIKELCGDTYHHTTDKSPTRRRDYIIKQVFPRWLWIVAAVKSLLICYLFIPYDDWYMKIAFTMLMILFYIIIYFFIYYWVAKFIYDREMKGGKK